MILNNLHKFWIQNKIDIIDWVFIIAFVMLAIYFAVNVHAAKTIIASQQHQITELQEQSEHYRAQHTMCVTLRTDPSIEKIMRAK